MYTPLLAVRQRRGLPTGVCDLVTARRPGKVGSTSIDERLVPGVVGVHKSQLVVVSIRDDPTVWRVNGVVRIGIGQLGSAVGARVKDSDAAGKVRSRVDDMRRIAFPLGM